MKRADLSGFDAEFPPYETEDPNAETFDDWFRRARADLTSFVDKMNRDRSYEAAARAQTALLAVAAFENEFPVEAEYCLLTWEPTGD